MNSSLLLLRRRLAHGHEHVHGMGIRQFGRQDAGRGPRGRAASRRVADLDPKPEAGPGNPPFASGYVKPLLPSHSRLTRPASPTLSPAKTQCATRCWFTEVVGDHSSLTQEHPLALDVPGRPSSGATAPTKPYSWPSQAARPSLSTTGSKSLHPVVVSDGRQKGGQRYGPWGQTPLPPVR